MHQLIIAATSNFKVLSIRDKQSGSAIRSEVNTGHIICGRDNKKHSVVVQETGTVHQKGCTQWCSVKRDTFRTEL